MIIYFRLHLRPAKSFKNLQVPFALYPYTSHSVMLLGKKERPSGRLASCAMTTMTLAEPSNGSIFSRATSASPRSSFIAAFSSQNGVTLASERLIFAREITSKIEPGHAKIEIVLLLSSDSLISSEIGGARLDSIIRGDEQYPLPRKIKPFCEVRARALMWLCGRLEGYQQSITEE